MNKDHLKILIHDLEFLLGELKSEVFSDTSAYIDTDKYYSSSRVTYEDQHDDDGAPD